MAWEVSRLSSESLGEPLTCEDVSRLALKILDWMVEVAGHIALPILPRSRLSLKDGGGDPRRIYRFHFLAKIYEI